MMKLTKSDLVALLLEIEHIEAAFEYQTGFNSYDYFLNEVLKMNNEQVLNCVTMDHDS